jgi:predicted flap endonuclease-1-like 5' DNA nuclease
VPEDAPVPTEYPPAIGATARRALAAEGLTRWDQLTDRHAADLLALHGVGPKAVRLLREGPAARGAAFADERPG